MALALVNNLILEKNYGKKFSFLFTFPKYVFGLGEM